MLDYVSVFEVNQAMAGECDPNYGRVDDILEQLTKSKSLHILMVLDRANSTVRFSDLKNAVDASSTTVSRRLKELEDFGLVAKVVVDDSSSQIEYCATQDTKLLSPIMQSLYDWVANRK